MRTKFSMSIAELEKQATDKIAAVTRDSKEFADYEIVPKDLQVLLDVLIAIPTDEELLGDQTDATKYKSGVEDAMRQKIGVIAQHISNRFTENSSQYRKLGIHGLSKTTDFELKRLAERVIRVAPAVMPEFAVGGKWASEVDALSSSVNDFIKADKMQHDAVVNRGLHTEDRTDAANALYEKLLTVCETGRKIWKGKSETKYNDYVLYDAPPPATPAKETDNNQPK